MFSKDKVVEGRGERSMPPTIISANVRINGDISSDGEIQVDGTIEGDVKCFQLSVGQSGVITGNVKADKTLVHGQINGQIESDSVTLSGTAQVKGDLVHLILAIEAGAQFEGNCRRLEQSAKSAEGSINLVVNEATPDLPEVSESQSTQTGTTA